MTTHHYDGCKHGQNRDISTNVWESVSCKNCLKKRPTATETTEPVVVVPVQPPNLPTFDEPEVEPEPEVVVVMEPPMVTVGVLFIAQMVPCLDISVPVSDDAAEVPAVIEVLSRFWPAAAKYAEYLRAKEDYVGLADYVSQAINAVAPHGARFVADDTAYHFELVDPIPRPANPREMKYKTPDGNVRPQFRPRKELAERWHMANVVHALAVTSPEIVQVEWFSVTTSGPRVYRGYLAIRDLEPVNNFAQQWLDKQLYRFNAPQD